MVRTFARFHNNKKFVCDLAVHMIMYQTIVYV